MTGTEHNEPSEQPLSALQRLADAVGGLDVRTAEVVVCHVAIEQEVNLALSKVVRHPEQLKGLNLVHSQKVLAALWTAGPPAPLATLLLRWEELRNHMAHGRSASAVPGLLQKLKNAALAMGVQGVGDDSITIAGLAAFTCQVLSTGGHQGLVHLLRLPVDALTTNGQPLIAILKDDRGELARENFSSNMFLTATRDGHGPCKLDLHMSNGAVQVVPMNTTTVAFHDTIQLTVLPPLSPENAELLTIR
jgi:hypothetical protein